MYAIEIIDQESNENEKGYTVYQAMRAMSEFCQQTLVRPSAHIMAVLITNQDYVKWEHLTSLVFEIHEVMEELKYQPSTI